MSKIGIRDFLNEIEERKTAGLYILAPILEELILDGYRKKLVESRDFKDLEDFEEDFEEDLNFLINTTISFPDIGDGQETNFTILEGYHVVKEKDNTKSYMIEFGRFFTWAVSEYIKPVVTKK